MLKAATFLFLHLLFYVPNFLKAQEIREFMDLQTHPTTFVPYHFFDRGLEYFDETNPPELTYKHQFTVINFANYLQDNPGSRILVTGALPPEAAVSKKRAKELVLFQIDYINTFAEEHSDKFVVAKSPEEVRNQIHNTDKTVIIHSIEGGKKLVNSQEEANFWAEKGVAFITLIHLIDDQHGGSGIRPGLSTNLLNYKGTLKKIFAPNKRRGLTDKGKQAILWLANAGIMTDLTHMSDDTRKDALDFMEKHKLPPIVTHDMFKPIQNSPRGISEIDMLHIYRINGFTSLPISGISLKAYKPYPEIKAELDTMKKYCPGSIDTYIYSYEKLKSFLEQQLDSVSWGNEFSPTTVKSGLSIGFQSDFDGWLDHSRPRYGKEGCWEIDSNKTYEPIELQGLAHPGLMESQWRLMEKEGVDIVPIQRASEKFLQVWEYFLARKGAYN